MISYRITALFAVLSLFGCTSAAYHRQQVDAAQEGDRLTAGVVQREIRVGMSGGDVASILGSPNIVSTDENRREVWIYDRISTDVTYSTGSGGVAGLIVGAFAVGSGGIAGGPAGSYASSAGAASKTQKTLTVVIKFDQNKRVRDFAYHQSTF